MSLKPIVLDLETSGIDKVRCGVWQIGAYDLNTKEEFFEECRLDDEDIVAILGNKTLYEIVGKTEDELRDKNKQSQKQLLENFFNWVEEKPMKTFLCQNPQFNVIFLEIKAMKYNLKIPFHFRAFDLHNVAQTRYHDLHGEFLVREKEDYSGRDLTNVLKLCGVEDNRKAHNALEDCKLTAECFSRLIYGKNLFPEYSEYKIPEELRKE